MKSYEAILKSNYVFQDEEVLGAVYRMAQLPDVADADWRTYALCRELDPELFDDAIKKSPSVELALRACNSCLVKDQCLDYAMTSNESYLVFGGLMSEQRRSLRRKNGRRPR
jgi:WhiB family redox-sensing transcriptional regulator